MIATTPTRMFGLRRRLRSMGRSLATRMIWLAAAAVGLVAAPFGRPARDFDQKSVRRILVIRLDLLGDLVLSLPAIQGLHGAYPHASITMLVLPYAAPLLNHHPNLDKVLAFDINRLRPSGEMLRLAPYGDLWNLLRSLRAGHYDLAVSLHGFWASLFAFASGAPFRAGYRDESCPFMLNLTIPGKRYRVKKHEAEYCLDIVRSLGSGPGTTGEHDPILVPSVAARAAVDRLIGETSRELVAIHPGASNGAAKRWTAEGFAALADRLIGEDGVRVAFTGSKGDGPAIVAIVGLMHHPPLVLAGRTAIPELVALLARCRLFIGGDTGPMHVANALDVPVVAIHGPTDPALSGPYGGAAIVVRRVVPCGPCYDLSETADCPRGDPICMTDITVEEVYAAAKQQLERNNR